LAISAFTINFKRQKVVDFTKPFLSLGISILYKVPTSSKPGLFSFLNPLSPEIWVYVGITLMSVSLVMMVLARFSPYEWRNTHPCNFNNEYVENQFTVWNSLWFAVGTLMQQGRVKFTFYLLIVILFFSKKNSSNRFRYKSESIIN